MTNSLNSCIHAALGDADTVYTKAGWINGEGDLYALDDAGLVAFMERDMAVREPFYAQAHLVVDCDAMSDDQVVEHILRQLGLK